MSRSTSLPCFNIVSPTKVRLPGKGLRREKDDEDKEEKVDEDDEDEEDRREPMGCLDTIRFWKIAIFTPLEGRSFLPCRWRWRWR